MQNCFKYQLLVLLFAIVVNNSQAQVLTSSLRQTNKILLTDTIVVDSLSLVPGSVRLFDENYQQISEAYYSVDYTRSLIILNPENNLKGKIISLKYRVLPINLSKSYGHKDTSLILKNYDPSLNRPTFIVKDKKEYSFANELDKNGSISRGFTFGNQRDLGSLSNLNMQLSGKLNDEVTILAAISDNNLPIQPEGNTQKIQEFDKVYVQLYNKTSGVRLGDIQLDKPTGYFLNLKKQSRGVNLYSKFDFKKYKNWKLKSDFSAGLAKGKYKKKKIDGAEGNQGPYRLTGNNNETYIVILSGSEKVYINGKLLTRGEKFDYVIDYNSAELTFTANQPITKDSRIIVEYEYAQQFYPRMQFLQTNQLTSKKAEFWLNIYHEQDNKNDPLSENYSDETKELLSEIGDSTHLAIAPNARLVEFENDRVLYRLKDSLINGVVYDSIYEYSTSSAVTAYQLGFSFVGENNGNYQAVLSNANGKVYEWIAPINSIPQGAYEPVSLFVAPNKSTMANLGGRFKTNQHGQAGFELAVSNFDENSFSSINDGDDAGYALKFSLSQGILNADTNNVQLKIFADYQLVNKQFKPIENFYEVEFERDWNLPRETSSWEEQRIGGGLLFKKKKLGFLSAQVNNMNRQNSYSGQQGVLNSDFRFRGFQLKAVGSYLQSKDLLSTTSYLKHHLTFARHFKYFSLGVSEETEDNLWKLKHQDSLAGNSFKFYEYTAFVKEADSSVNKYFVNYKYREDFLPIKNLIQKSATAQTTQAGISLLKNKNIQWKSLATYRDIIYIDSAQLAKKNDFFLSGRQEIGLKMAKGSINISGFYEIGSGLEIKKQYQYIEVQKGQGQFTWIDYNQNEIKELDEFELAKFPDEADHIRIFTPSNEYVRIYKTQLSSTLLLNPARVWRKQKGFRGFLSLFSDQMAYRIMQKTENPQYIPNFEISDDITSQMLIIRNNFSFRSRNRNWQTDYIYEKSSNKSLLINGIDTRDIENNSVRIKWRPFKLLTLYSTSLLGSNSFSSEFFSWKDYKLEIKSEEFSCQIQPGEAFYTTVLYRYAEKINRMGLESVFLNEAKLAANQNISRKVNIQADISYVQTNYTGENNSPVAYEMLEGLQNGQNIIWNLTYNQKLSKVFHLNISYNGRTSEASPIIHNASVQLRANF